MLVNGCAKWLCIPWALRALEPSRRLRVEVIAAFIMRFGMIMLAAARVGDHDQHKAASPTCSGSLYLHATTYVWTASY